MALTQERGRPIAQLPPPLSSPDFHEKNLYCAYCALKIISLDEKLLNSMKNIKIQMTDRATYR